MILDVHLYLTYLYLRFIFWQHKCKPTVSSFSPHIKDPKGHTHTSLGSWGIPSSFLCSGEQVVTPPVRQVCGRLRGCLCVRAFRSAENALCGRDKCLHVRVHGCDSVRCLPAGRGDSDPSGWRCDVCARRFLPYIAMTGRVVSPVVSASSVALSLQPLSKTST